MTVLKIERAVWDKCLANDPDATLAAAGDTWRRALGKPGQWGATYDDQGQELTPFTHYRWGHNVLADDDAVEEFAELVEAVTTTRARPKPKADETGQQHKTRKTAARIRARQMTRQGERKEDRTTARTTRRVERRKKARAMHRTAVRKAERRGEEPPPEFDQVEDEWMRKAANTLGSTAVVLDA